MPFPTYTYTFGATSFGTGIIAEDVLQFIVNITPAETPLLATIPTVEVGNIMHDWIQDSLMGTSTAGAPEAFEFSGGSAAIPVRGTAATRNITQIFQKGVKVSNSMARANPHAVDNWYKYQSFKAMREKTRDLERVILSRYTGQSAVGSTAGVARKMRRFVDFCKNAGNRFHLRQTAIGEAGGAVTACATIFNDRNVPGILATVYQEGGYPNVCHVNQAGKRQISSTTVNPNSSAGAFLTRRNINAADREMYYPVDILYTEFGELELYMNRNMSEVPHGRLANSAGTTEWNGTAVFFERGMVRLGVYRPFDHVPLTPGGDYMRGYVVGEYTLEIGNANACMWIRGVAGWAD